MDEASTPQAKISDIIALLREIKEAQAVQTKHLFEMFRFMRQATWRDSNRYLRELLQDPRYADGRRLEHHGYSVYSEGGEDGMIQEIFRRIGTTNRRFVEFGVAGGIQNLTHYLLYLGWSGLWLEVVPTHVASIRRVFAKALEANRLQIQNVKVTADNINDVIAESGITGEIDFLSVDIDNQDYHVCRAIDVIVPRVVVVECHPMLPPPVEWVAPFSADGSYHGFMRSASLASMTRMMETKGYTLVGTEISGHNAFYVRSDLIEGRFAQAGNLEALYNPPRRGFGHLAYQHFYEAPRFWSAGHSED